jgi:hypothetical protein
MKKTGLLVLLARDGGLGAIGGGRETHARRGPRERFATTAVSHTMRVQMPTYADLYCAGFISKQILPDANFVAGDCRRRPTRNSLPAATLSSWRAGYSAGAEYEDRARAARCKRIRNVPGQKKLLKETGHPYEEVGRVRIIDTRSKTAIAPHRIRV